MRKFIHDDNIGIFSILNLHNDLRIGREIRGTWLEPARAGEAVREEPYYRRVRVVFVFPEHRS